MQFQGDHFKGGLGLPFVLQPTKLALLRRVYTWMVEFACIVAGRAGRFEFDAGFLTAYDGTLFVPMACPTGIEPVTLSLEG